MVPWALSKETLSSEPFVGLEHHQGGPPKIKGKRKMSDLVFQPGPIPGTFSMHWMSARWPSASTAPGCSHHAKTFPSSQTLGSPKRNHEWPAWGVTTSIFIFHTNGEFEGPWRDPYPSTIESSNTHSHINYCSGKHLSISIHLRLEGGWMKRKLCRKMTNKDIDFHVPTSHRVSSLPAWKGSLLSDAPSSKRALLQSRPPSPEPQAHSGQSSLCTDREKQKHVWNFFLNSFCHHI